LNCFAPLSADRAPESADFVVARRGKNASALSLLSTAARDPVLNCFAPLSADRAPNPPTSSSLAEEERLRALLLSTAARDPLADARLGILSTPPMEGKDQEEGDH
jgi:hypothetical protein